MCILLLRASLAAGQEDPELNLDWSSPQECSSADEVLDNVKTFLGSSWQGEIRQRFKGEVVKGKKKWHVSLHVIEGEAEYTRSLKVHTCEAVTQVVAVLIALAINPSLVLDEENTELQSSLATLDEAKEAEKEEAADGSVESGPEEQQDFEEESENEEPDDDDDAPEEKTEEDEREVEAKKDVDHVRKKEPLGGALGASFVADFGTLSAFRPGFSLAGSVWITWVRVFLSGRYLPPKETVIVEGDSAKFNNQLVEGTVGVGGHFRLGSFHLDPLLGISFHTVFAKAWDIETPGEDNISFMSLWFGIQFDWIVTKHFGIGLHPAIHYFLSRPGFEIPGIEDWKYQPSSVSGVVKIGVFYNF